MKVTADLFLRDVPGSMTPLEAMAEFGRVTGIANGPYLNEKPQQKTITEKTVTNKSEDDERLSEMIEYAERFIRAAKALQEGRPITESYDEIFLENKREMKKVRSSLAEIIEHLYKFALCDSEVNLERDWVGWNKSINHQRKRLHEVLDWNYGGDTDLISHTKRDIEKIYSSGKKEYEKSMETNPSLVLGHRRIPKGITWSLEELMDSSINNLIIKLMKHIEPGGINPDDWNRVLIEKLGL